MLFALPGAAELRPAQDRREPGALPAAALLHDRLCPFDLPGLAAVPGSDSSRADAAAELKERSRSFRLLLSVPEHNLIFVKLLAQSET